MTVCLATALYDATKSSIFGKRNLDKTCNGDFVRAAVVAGQAKNVTVAVSNFNNPVGNVAKHCLENFDALKKTTSGMGVCAKVVDGCSRAINPLICLSGATKVVMADDKQTEAVKQMASLTGMFSLERVAKYVLTRDGYRKLSKSAIGKNPVVAKLIALSAKLDKTAAKGSRFTALAIPFAKGLTFVAMSINGYAIGSKLGDFINDEIKSDSKPSNKGFKAVA